MCDLLAGLFFWRANFCFAYDFVLHADDQEQNGVQPIGSAVISLSTKKSTPQSSPFGKLQPHHSTFGFARMCGNTAMPMDVPIRVNMRWINSYAFFLVSLSLSHSLTCSTLDGNDVAATSHETQSLAKHGDKQRGDGGEGAVDELHSRGESIKASSLLLSPNQLMHEPSAMPPPPQDSPQTELAPRKRRRKRDDPQNCLANSEVSRIFFRPFSHLKMFIRWQLEWISFINIIHICALCARALARIQRPIEPTTITKTSTETP